MKLLIRLSVSNLAFTTNVETLDYYRGRIDLYTLYHRYQKKVNFLVRHLTQLVTIYSESVI